MVNLLEPIKKYQNFKKSA